MEMERIEMEHMSLRALTRAISYGDLALSFIAVGYNIMLAVSIPLFNWQFLDSNYFNQSIDSTSETILTATARMPNDFQLWIVSDVSNGGSLLSAWLFSILIALTFLIRTSGAYALLKATTKGKDSLKARIHCAYWTTMNIIYIVFMVWIVYQRYIGTFANIDPISASDFYGCIALLILHGVTIGIVFTFATKIED